MKHAKDIAKELLTALRDDNALRHRLGIEGAVDQLEGGDEDTLAYTDNEGETWFLHVEQG